MEIGVHLTAAGDIYHVAERYTRLIDRLCPDCVWLSDHPLTGDWRALADRSDGPNGSCSGPAELLDPFVTAATLIQYMPRPTRFGITSADCILRTPSDLARAAYTLNQVLPGPLNIGFSAGEAIDLASLGCRRDAISFDHFEQNLQRFVSINGSGVFQRDDRAVGLGCHSHPSSVWIAGQRPHMLRIAGSLADGWLPVRKMSPDEYRGSVSTLRQVAHEQRRNSPTPGLFAIPLLGPSRSDLFDHFRGSPTRRSVACIAPAELWRKWGLKHPAEATLRGVPDSIGSDVSADVAHDALLSIPAEMMADILFLGSVPEVLEEFWLYREAGLEHLSLLLPDFSRLQLLFDVPDFMPEFELLCREMKSW